MPNANIDIDANKLYDKVRQDLAGLIDGAKIASALIHNASGGPVTFEVYNYIDCANWVPAQKAYCAADGQATVAASGLHFKIHPNGNKAHEFLVAPRHAYIYRGPGKIEHVTA